VERLPHIPLESDIDQLIGALPRRVRTFLQLVKETGARPREAWELRWIDIGPNNTIMINAPEKNSKPRAIKVSSRLIAMLNTLPRRCRYIFKMYDEQPFKSFRDYFYRRRRRIAEELQNPKLLMINFRSLRHFKATMEYAKTKDILHVKRILGHKRIENTLIYTHLINFNEDEWICKIASNIKEAKELIEKGFEYVTDFEGKKLFRKRK